MENAHGMFSSDKKEVTNVDTFVERHMNLYMCTYMNRKNQEGYILKY